MAKVVRYKDIDTALRIYYQRPELSNSDLTELFPGVGESTIARWKKKIHAMEIEEDVRLSQARVINTKIAYKFFGIDTTSFTLILFPMVSLPHFSILLFILNIVFFLRDKFWQKKGKVSVTILDLYLLCYRLISFKLFLSSLKV